MAYLEFPETYLTTSSFGVRFAGLSEEWTTENGTRTGYFFLGETGKPTADAYADFKVVPFVESSPTGISVSTVATFTGLTSNTKYYVGAYIQFPDGTTTDWFYKNVTTLEEITPDPEPVVWTFNKLSTDDMTGVEGSYFSYEENETCIYPFYYTEDCTVTFRDDFENLIFWLTYPDVEGNEENGKLLNSSDYLAYGDSYNGQTEFTYDIEAYTTYWLWSRTTSGSANNSGTGAYIYFEVDTSSNPDPDVQWTFDLQDEILIPATAGMGCSIGENNVIICPIKNRTEYDYRVTFSSKYGNENGHGLKAYLTPVDIELDYYNGCPLRQEDILASGDDTNEKFNFSHILESGTSHWLLIRTIDGSASLVASDNYIILGRKKLVSGIESFEWTTAEKNAFNNKGATTALTWRRWNELCDKVQEVITYTGDVWDNRHANLANTKATASGQTFTARQFNSLRYNIDSKYTGGTGIDDQNGKTIYTTTDGVQIGDENNPDIVYGKYFIKIVTSLNNWIASL